MYGNAGSSWIDDLRAIFNMHCKAYMLLFFRKIQNTPVLRIFIGLLLFIFVLWGIGDIFRSSRSTDYVLKVGSEKIDEAQFRNAMNQELQYISRWYGNVDLKELQRQGVVQQVFEKMLASALVREEARALGLNVNDDVVKTEIASQAAFAGDDGKFNKERFQEALEKIGLTEEQFVKMVRESLMMDVMLGWTASNQLMPLEFANIMQSAIDVKKKVKKYIIDVPQISRDFSDEDLKAVFEEYKEQFFVPEVRNMSYVTFNKNIVSDNFKPTEAELREMYKARLEMMEVPELRQFENAVLKDEKAVEAVRAALKQGKAFADAVKDYNAEIVPLKEMPKEAFVPNMRDKLFALEKGEYSDALKSELGYHIFHLLDIKPARIIEFKEVQSVLEQEYKEEKRFEALAALVAKMEEDANLLSFPELAAKYNLQLKTSVFTEGVQNKDLNEFAQVYPIVLELSEGKTSHAIQGADGKFVLIHIDKVAPRVYKAFENVKQDVAKIAKERLRSEIQISASSQLMELLKKGEDVKDGEIIGIKFDDSAAESVEKSAAKATVENAKIYVKTLELSRKSEAEDMLTIFSMKTGDVVGPIKSADSNVVVYKLLETIKPVRDAGFMKAAEKLQKEPMLRQAHILLGEYLTYLRNKHSVQINEEFLQNFTIE